jgi:hypothetical protein
LVVTPEGFRGPFFKQNSGPKPRQEARWSHHHADFGCGFSHDGRKDLQKNCSNETALIVGTMTHAKPLPKERYSAPGL